MDVAKSFHASIGPFAISNVCKLVVRQVERNVGQCVIQKPLVFFLNFGTKLEGAAPLKSFTMP